MKKILIATLCAALCGCATLRAVLPILSDPATTQILIDLGILLERIADIQKEPGATDEARAASASTIAASIAAASDLIGKLKETGHVADADHANAKLEDLLSGTG